MVIKNEGTSEKEENEEKLWQEAAGADTIKHLGPISKEEYEYYENFVLKEKSQI